MRVGTTRGRIAPGVASVGGVEVSGRRVRVVWMGAFFLGAGRFLRGVPMFGGRRMVLVNKAGKLAEDTCLSLPTIIQHIVDAPHGATLSPSERSLSEPLMRAEAAIGKESGNIGAGVDDFEDRCPIICVSCVRRVRG